MRQGILNFPFFSMQLKTADHKYTNVMEPICAREDITIPTNDRHMVSMYSELYYHTLTSLEFFNRAMTLQRMAI